MNLVNSLVGILMIILVQINHNLAQNPVRESNYNR